MIIIAAILAAAPADAVPKARKAYAGCLTDVTTEAVDSKAAREEFLASLKSKCAEKEAAFRAALIATDRAEGMSAQEATQDADDQVAEYIEKMTGDFDSAK